MSREEVKALFNSWGVENPTDEQVSDYLNKIQQATKSAEDKATRYKAEADKVRDLQKQLDEINNEKLTDAEKSQKAIEDANKRVMELEATVTSMKLQKELAEIGITGEQAEGLFTDDGSLNVAKLGEIITGREKTAVANFEKDALLKTPNPEGGEPDSDVKDTPDIAAAKSYVTRAKSTNDAQSIINQYIGGEKE